jgi:hypothetical protein
MLKGLDKLAENNGGYKAVKFGKTSELVYTKLNAVDLSTGKSYNQA